jgi:hypothetical protein
MSYKSSATSNIDISQFEVVFGRLTNNEIDWSVMTSEPTTDSIQQYATEIRPKLEALHQIAEENDRDSAAQHALAHNETARSPPSTIGDKVLLFNPVTKKG